MQQYTAAKAETVTGAAVSETPFIHFPPFRLDRQNQCLWRGEQSIALKPRAFAILSYLIERPQTLVTKLELLRELWGNVHVGDAVLRTHLREIRLALGDSVKSPRFIETAHRRGYRFIGQLGARERETAAPAGPPALACAPDFVGREKELARLQAARGRASLGRRQLVVVSGPPGIGKTSLVRAFLARLPPGSQSVAWGHCVDHYGAGEAYLPILEALGRLARGAWRARLLELLGRYAPSWLARLPSFWGASGAPASAVVGLGAAPERMLRELAEVLEAFAADDPLLLLLEDVHWADVSTLAWLSYLARRTDPVRLLVVCTHRPLDMPVAEHPLLALKRELGRLEHHRELCLSDLSEREVIGYFNQRFQQNRFPPALFQLAHARTGGHPLFLDRVVDSWVKRRLLSRGSGPWQLVGSLRDLERGTPPSVLSMIEREIERLTPFEREVLDAASVVGRQFSVASAAAALGADVVTVEQVCERWGGRGQLVQNAGLDRWPDGTLAARFEFAHSLYQDAAYRRIGPTRRALLHQRIGARLELAYGGRAREIAPELALHFERGEDPRAIRYHGLAGEQALAKNAYQEASQHFAEGLALLERLPATPDAAKLELDLQVNRGAALAITQGYGAPQVEAAYSRARALCRQLGETPRLFQALMGIGAYHFVRGEYRAAVLVGEQFLLLHERHPDDGAQLQASLLLGVANTYLGELEVALGHLERALTLYDLERHQSHHLLYMQDPAVAAGCFAALVLWLLGHRERALARLCEALALATRQSNPHAIVLALTFQAMIAQLAGDLLGSRRHAERGLELCAEFGFVFCGEILRIVWGVSRLVPGELELGLHAIIEATALAKSSGSEFGGTGWRAALAGAHAAAGRGPEALAALGEAFERVERESERWWQPQLYQALAELLPGTPPAALPAACRRALGMTSPTVEGCLLHALELARGMNAKSLELRAGMALAHHWLASAKTAGQKRALARRAFSLVGGIYAGFPPGAPGSDLADCVTLLRELELEGGTEDLAPRTPRRPGRPG